MINMSLSSYNYEPSLVGNAPIVGNLIPHSWYKAFTTESGRPDNTLISILSEIFYWYRPSRAGGSKFASDAWQTSYDHFTTKFHYSKETIRRVFVKLEKLGVAYRELRVIKSYGQRYNNVLFIHLNHEILSSLTEPARSGDKLTDKLANKNFCASSHKFNTPSPQIVGDHIEGEIKLKSILIRSDLSKSDFANNEIPIHESYTTEVNQETEQGSSNEEFDPEVVQVIAPEPQSNPLSSQSVPSSLSSFQDSSTRPEPTTNIRKSISEFHPLTEEDAEYLRLTSGKPFTLRFINKLLLKLSAKYPDQGAYTKRQLLAHLIPFIKIEKTNPEVGNLENFNFRPIEGTEEYTNRKKYKYLKTIEHSEQTDPITQIKRKIIGLTAGDNEYAYHILANCSLPYIPNNFSRKKSSSNYNDADTNNENNYITTDKDLNQSKLLTRGIIKITNLITEDQKEILIKATKEILGQGINITFKDKKPHVVSAVTSVSSGQFDNSNSRTNPISNLEHEPQLGEPESLTLHSPLWQKIRSLLKQRHGEAIDRSWFAKLDIEVQACAGAKEERIKIKCPNSFTRDWIKTNYGNTIENATEYARGQFVEVEYVIC